MRFLFTTQVSNDLGLLTRSLPIATELRKRGHQIAFCNPANAPRKLIAEAGFENLLPKHPIYYLNHQLFTDKLNIAGIYQLLRSKQIKQDFGGMFSFLHELIRVFPKIGTATPEIWSLDHMGVLTGMLSENFVRSECMAFVQLMTEYGADIVVDSWHPVACMAARVLQRPLITILQADMHPNNNGFIWWKEHPINIPSPTPILNKVLADYGFGPIRKTEDLLVGDLSLVLGMPETDPLPSHTPATYIGAILWQKEDAKPPDWFSQLDRNKPVIWIYSGNPQYLPIGTPMDSSIVIRSCIAALAKENVQVVLTTGYHTLPKKVLPLPANFRHVPYVPGILMAKRSDLMIHHGGFGSCQTGLFTGTPAVIIPTYSERESNARRISAVGAGEYISPIAERSGTTRQISAGELRGLVTRVLSTPSYSENTKLISQKLQTFGGVTYATRLIEEFGNSKS
jgi:UDP:flavonoid glycosyltransferase YjiC (YdhE family)